MTMDVHPLEVVGAVAAVWWLVVGIRRELERHSKASLFGALLNSQDAGSASVIKLLLPHSAAMGHTGPAGVTMLHAAVLGRAAGALSVLVAAGAPINATLENTRTGWPWDATWGQGIVWPYDEADSRWLAGVFHQQRHLVKLLSRAIRR
jgi:hypothetical protein